jgi:hypothetical protein
LINFLKTTGKNNKNEKYEQELTKLYIIDQDKISKLNDYKLELLKKCNYLVEYHIKKLNEKIQTFENNIVLNPQSIFTENDLLKLDNNELNLNLNETKNIGTGKTGKSGKSDKHIKNGKAENISTTQTKTLLNKKKRKI